VQPGSQGHVQAVGHEGDKARQSRRQSWVAADQQEIMPKASSAPLGRRRPRSFGTSFKLLFFLRGSLSSFRSSFNLRRVSRKVQVFSARNEIFRVF
jgi:hypothetical protein